MTSTAPRKVIVDIVGDAKGYKKATDDAVKVSTGFAGKMKSLDDRLQAIGKRGGVSGALLGGAGIGVGLGVFGLVERGVSGVVNAMGDAVQAAIEDERATAKLTQTIKANVAAWDGQLDVVNQAIDAGAQLAFTDDDVRDGLNQLIPRTKDLTEAIRLNRLAMDLARAKSMGLEEAATLVGKAFSGQASALRRAGINIKNTKDSTAALAELQRAVSGQATTYANSTEGAMKRLDIQLSEAMESLGYALKPLVASLAGLASSIIPQVVGAIGLFGEAMHNLQRISDPTLAATEDLNYAIIAQSSAFGVSADKVIQYKDAIVSARKEAAAQADLVARMQAQFSESDAYFIQQAKVLGISADEAKNRFLSGQVSRIDAMARSLGMTFSQLLEAAPLLLTAGDSVDTYLKHLAQLSIEMRETGVEAEAVNQTIAEQGLEFVRLFAASQKVGDAGRIVMGAFEGMFSGARRAGAALAPGNPSGPAAAIRRTRTQMLQTMAGFMEPWKTAWREAAAWAKDPFRPAKFQEWVADRVKEATRKAKKAAEDGKPEIARRWRAIAAAMKSPVITAVGEIKTSIAEVIRAMKIVQEVAKRTGTTRMGSTDKVAGRASGGPVRAGTPYVVGEHRAELFVPDQDGTIIPRLGMGGGGGNTFNVNVTVHAGPGANGARVGQEIAGYLEQYARGGGQAHLKRLVTSGSR